MEWTAELLRLALTRSKLSTAPLAVDAIDEGARIEEGMTGLVRSEFLGIYAFRAKHVAKKRSAHAQQLATATLEFVEALRSASDNATLGTVGINPEDAEYEFLVFLLEGSFPRVLGCLKTVSQLDVSLERWAELWGEDPSL